MTWVRHVSWAVRSASLFTCGLLFMVGVISFTAHDREIPPGTSALVRITNVKTSETAAVSALETVAVDRGVNLLRIGANPVGPEAPPWYFVFVGDERLLTEILSDESYPAFSPSQSPRLFDGSEVIEMNQPVRGSYAVVGRTSITELDAALTLAGFSAEVSAVHPVLDYLARVLQSSSWPALLAALLALGLVTIQWVVASRRSLAVLQVSGRSGLCLTLQQLTGLMVTYTASGLVVLALGTALLACYNDLNQYRWFIPWFVIPLVIIGGGVAVTHVVASVLALRLSPLRSLSGARPVLLLAVIASVSQLTVLVLVFATAAQTIAGALSLASDARTFDHWEGESGSVTAQINLNAFENPGSRVLSDDVADAYRKFAQITSRLDDEGSAVLSLHQTASDTGLEDARITSYEPFGGNSMIVNDNYLDCHSVVDPAGHPITDLDTAAGRIDLLVPESLLEHGDALRESWSSSTLAARDPYGLGAPPESYDVTIHPVADDQTIFNYGDSGRMENWTQRGPVVAVVSLETGYLSPHNLLGVAANDGNLVFTDADAFRALAADHALLERFSSVSSPASSAAEQMRERTSRITILFGSALIGVTVLVAAMLLVSAVYTDTRRRSSFVKHTQGWSWLRVHQAFVVTSLGSSAAVLALTVPVLGPAAGLTLEASGLLTLGVFSVAAVVLAVGTLSLDRRARADLLSRH
jgi:hypothetical protein